jgi:hypothetical protein
MCGVELGGRVIGLRHQPDECLLACAPSTTTPDNKHVREPRHGTGAARGHGRLTRRLSHPDNRYGVVSAGQVGSETPRLTGRVNWTYVPAAAMAASSSALTPSSTCWSPHALSTLSPLLSSTSSAARYCATWTAAQARVPFCCSFQGTLTERRKVRLLGRRVARLDVHVESVRMKQSSRYSNQAPSTTQFELCCVRVRASEHKDPSRAASSIYMPMIILSQHRYARDHTEGANRSSSDEQHMA